MYALYYISMLGKPLVFVKALSCVPYLRSQCYGSTLFPRRRPSQRHEELENVHSTLCVSPRISREKELERKEWDYTFGHTEADWVRKVSCSFSLQTDGRLRQKQLPVTMP